MPSKNKSEYYLPTNSYCIVFNRKTQKLVCCMRVSLFVCVQEVGSTYTDIHLIYLALLMAPLYLHIKQQLSCSSINIMYLKYERMIRGRTVRQWNWLRPVSSARYARAAAQVAVLTIPQFTPSSREQITEEYTHTNTLLISNLILFKQKIVI